MVINVSSKKDNNRMKKTYISPSSHVITIRLIHSLAQMSGDKLYLNRIESDGDASQAASRRSVWDDDE